MELLQEHISWWIQNLPTADVPLIDPVPTTVTEMYTDASHHGWGAHTESQVARGEWTAYERTDHINILEMMAVQKGLEAFDHLRGANTWTEVTDHCITADQL